MDGIRAIAVVLVLLFHLQISGWGGGFVGVDVFLVVSGYVITRLICSEVDETGRLDLRGFYLRRIRRLLPALVAVSASVLVAGFLLYSPGRYRECGKEITAALLSVSNIRLWLTADYFDADARTKPLLHTWSLGLEVQFYLFWPLAVLCLRRIRSRAIQLLLVVALAAASLALNPMFANGAPLWLRDWSRALENGSSTIFYLLPFRAFEFALGAMLVWFPRTWRRGGTVADMFVVVGLALILVAARSFGERTEFPSFAALLPCTGAMALIFYGGQSRLSGILCNPIAASIGVISYSLYLVHWPLLVLWEYVAGPLDMTGTLAVASISLALAAASHRWIEAPFRRTWPIGPPIWAGAGVLVLSIAVIAGRGFPWRLDSAVSRYATLDSRRFQRDANGGSGWPNGRLAGEGAIDLLVVGDSHAKHLSEGIAREICEPSGLSAWVEARNGCFCLPGFLGAASGQDREAARGQVLTTAAEIIAASDPQPVVILAHSWLGQVRQSNFSLSDRVAPRSAQVEDIPEGIRRFRRLTGARHVIVIGDIPQMPQNELVEELTKPALVRRQDLDALRTFPISRQHVGTNTRLRELSRDGQEYLFLDPTEVFCDGEVCTAMRGDGVILYSDQNHLTHAGSRMLVRALRGEILRMVRSRLDAPSDSSSFQGDSGATPGQGGAAERGSENRVAPED